MLITMLLAFPNCLEILEPSGPVQALAMLALPSFFVTSFILRKVLVESS